MPYDEQLADSVREFLLGIPALEIEEKKMFRGLSFMVNGKMCVNVSEDNLMCRFDPALQEELAQKQGYLPMMMKGREYTGYCYFAPEGIRKQEDFEYYLKLCLDFNPKAKASKK